MPVVQIPPFNHSRVIAPTGNSSLNNRNSNTVGVLNTWSIMGIWKYEGNTLPSVPIMDIATSGGANRIEFFVGGGNQYTCDIRDTAAVQIKAYTWATITGPPVLPNTWQHFVATFDGTTLTMYINGTLTAKSASTADGTGTQIDGTREVAIGSTFAGASVWIGQISQVALWNKILTQNEAIDLYNNGGPWTFDLRAARGNYASQANLVRWWCCGRNGTYQEMCGTLPLIDLTLNSTLTEANDVTSECPNLNDYSRFSDQCLDMDGNVERLKSTTAQTMGFGNTWTILTWVKSLRDTNQENMFSYRHLSGNIDRIFIQKRGDLAAGMMEFDFFDSSAVVIRDNQYANLLPLNQWVGVLGTWDGTTFNVWYNGNKVGPTTVVATGTGAMGTSTRAVSWGNVPAGAPIGAANVRLYTAATWNTVLSDAECALLTQQNPSSIRWINLLKNGFGYSSASSLQQWFRAGLGPLVSVANSGYITNDGLGPTPVPSLAEGSSNMAVDDIFQDAPA